jgi:hypothetical protein
MEGEMHWKYLKSQLRHKWFVFLECCKLGIPWTGIVHDWSKFLPSEWFGYARYFYGNYLPLAKIPGDWRDRVFSKEDVAVQFDVAWLHHQHRNKHHWQRWLLTLDSARSDGKLTALPMPPRYRKEMLADWHGAGRAYGNSNTKQWYLENKDQMTLHPATRTWIEKQLGVQD